MKFRTKLVIAFMAMILAANLLMSGIVTYLFSQNFRAYLLEKQETELAKIGNDISTIIQTQNPALTNDLLAYYAQDQNIKITLTDKVGQILAVHDGMMRHSDALLERKEYNLLNNSLQPTGKLYIQYDLANPSVERTVYNFRWQLFQSAAIIAAALSAIGLIISFGLSNIITRPIARLADVAEAIRKKNYDVTPATSNLVEIRELSDNLDYLARTLKSQDLVRKNYAQDISHELRTPLTNMQMHLEGIQDGIIAPDEHAIEILIGSLNQLKSITEKLKITFDDSSLLTSTEFKHVDISAELLSILSSFEATLAKRKIRLIRVIEPNINLYTDPNLFRHIVTNLISNALKAVDDQTGMLHVAMNMSNHQIYLSVRDNGVGIPEASLPKLFERFYRVDSSRNSRIGGSGLGLSITKNIVDFLGGEITVSSQIGKGAVFTVILPGINAGRGRRKPTKPNAPPSGS